MDLWLRILLVMAVRHGGAFTFLLRIPFNASVVVLKSCWRQVSASVRQNLCWDNGFDVKKYLEVIGRPMILICLIAGRRLPLHPLSKIKGSQSKQVLPLRYHGEEVQGFQGQGQVQRQCRWQFDDTQRRRHCWSRWWCNCSQQEGSEMRTMFWNRQGRKGNEVPRLFSAVLLALREEGVWYLPEW